MPGQDLLLERLVQHEVEFVVVGGFAAVAHGVSLLTQDLDVCCRFSTENLLVLQDAIRDLHPVHRMTPQRLPFHLTQDSCRGLKNLYLDTDVGQLDCLSEVMGIGKYEDVYEQSLEVRLPVGSCRLLNINALIRAKQAMARPRDLEAIDQLRKIKEKE